MGTKKAHLTVVLMGQPRNGKSTTANRIISERGLVDKPLIERLKKEDAKRGITEGIALGMFETNKYYCTVIDTPGFDSVFLKKMIHDTGQAHCALLFIDSTTGGYEVGLHAIVTYNYVQHLICVCNKMDATTPAYSKAQYLKIVKEAAFHLKMNGYNYREISYVPISGSVGDNVIEKSTNLEWYKGPTLLQALDKFKPKRSIDSIVEDYIRATARRGETDMAVTVGPTGLTTEVKSVEMHHEAPTEDLPGDTVGVNVKNVAVKDLKRGYVASNSKDDPAKGAATFGPTGLTTEVKSVEMHHEAPTEDLSGDKLLYVRRMVQDGDKVQVVSNKRPSEEEMPSQPKKLMPDETLKNITTNELLKTDVEPESKESVQCKSCEGYLSEIESLKKQISELLGASSFYKKAPIY